MTQEATKEGNREDQITDHREKEALIYGITFAANAVGLSISIGLLVGGEILKSQFPQLDPRTPILRTGTLVGASICFLENLVHSGSSLVERANILRPKTIDQALLQVHIQMEILAGYTLTKYGGLVLGVLGLWYDQLRLLVAENIGGESYVGDVSAGFVGAVLVGDMFETAVTKIVNREKRTKLEPDDIAIDL